MSKKKDVVQSVKTKTASSTNEDNCTPKIATKSSSKGSGRTRNFAKIVYPTKDQYDRWYNDHKTYCNDKTGEVIDTPYYDGRDGYGETPDDWIDILRDTHVACLVSPLHAMDVNPDGSLKKPHYHVILMYDGVKTQDQANIIFDRIGGVGKEAVQSVRGYARYLTHLDNPEKYQYKDKPLCLGGVDYDAVIHLPGDDISIVRDMMQYIRLNQILSFAQFCDICAISNEEWFGSLVHRTGYIMKEYIKSVAWEYKHQ